MIDENWQAIIWFNFMMVLFAMTSTLCAAFFACFGPPKSKEIRIMEAIMEISFGIDIIKNFLLQYTDKEGKPVRDILKIALRYLKGAFIFDLIGTSSFFIHAVFAHIYGDDEKVDLIYLLRLLRLTKITILINTQRFSELVKGSYRRRLVKHINDSRGSEMEMDQSKDNNKIMQQIFIIYLFKVFRMIMFSLVLAYFIGTFWYMISKHTTHSPYEYTFFNEFGLAERDDWENLLLVMYFSFTTLSTVGFGDFHPKSEVERVVTTFILLVGVATFSFIMGQFIDILLNLQTVTASNEDSQNLSRWINLLKHFNKNRPLPPEMTREFEKYFEYYWANDKNNAIKSEDDMALMDELPSHI